MHANKNHYHIGFIVNDKAIYDSLSAYPHQSRATAMPAKAGIQCCSLDIWNGNPLVLKRFNESSARE